MFIWYIQICLMSTMSHIPTLFDRIAQLHYDSINRGFFVPSYERINIWCRKLQFHVEHRTFMHPTVFINFTGIEISSQRNHRPSKALRFYAKNTRIRWYSCNRRHRDFISETRREKTAYVYWKINTRLSHKNGKRFIAW